MESNSIQFSIVIPSYNRLEYLKLLIPKLEALNFTNWEAIIVDDGSFDGTYDFFLNWSNQNIVYLRQVNKERGAARNTGLQIAKGDYITFLDSDDYLLPNSLIVASDIIDKNPGIPLFHLGFEMRNREGDLLIAADVLPTLLNNTLIEKNAIACLGVFIKKDVAICHPFDESRELSGTEDYELWTRLAAIYPFLHFNKTIAVLVQHESRSMLDKDINKTIKRINKFIELVLADPVRVKYIGRNLNNFIAHRFSYISLHAAINNKNKIALNYLIKSLLKSPILLFRIRLYIILKKIIFN
jgi:glycosyltransferase involved in cell wall biosynthesis